MQLVPSIRHAPGSPVCGDCFIQKVAVDMLSGVGELMVTIEELIQHIEELDVDSTIYAVRDVDWTPASPAIVALRLRTDLSRPMLKVWSTCFEVSLARQVVDWWRDLNDRRDPTPREAAEAVIHYAVHDSL